jgi:glycosyltransferase involved in cell wall biosynthesis
MIEIAIFTRQNNEKLQNLIKDINNQSLENFKIKIYSDKYFELPNTKVIETKNKNISEKRNLAIQNSNSKYLFLLDDDNRIYDKKFLEKLLNKYKILKEKY